MVNENEECQHRNLYIMADCNYDYYVRLGENSNYELIEHLDNGHRDVSNISPLVICQDCDKQLDQDILSNRGIKKEGLPPRANDYILHITATWLDNRDRGSTNMTIRKYDGQRFELDDIRSVVRAYLETDEGRNRCSDTEHDFNWGDVISTIGTRFWREHGFEPLDGARYTNGVLINHDEVLCTHDE